MPMRILAQNGDSPSYLIGEGDPEKDQMTPCSVATLGEYIYPPVPFAQHLKWGDFHDTPNDPVLLKKLLALPKYPFYPDGKTPYKWEDSMREGNSNISVCDEVAGRYDSVRRSIHEYLDSRKPRGKSLGVLRCKLPIGVKRMRTIHHKVEETLQRTIMSLLNVGTPARWFNEFAVSAGVYGGRRKAVDLVHTSVDGNVWDFVELKEWNARDNPENVARQAQNYFFALSSLVERSVTPYNSCRPTAVRLWIMAPQTHFDRFGGAAIYESRVQDIALALEPLVKTHPTMLKVSFNPTPLVLDRTISKSDFIKMFDKDRIDALIGKNEPAANPLEILRPEKVAELRSWVNKAVNPLEK